MKKTMIKKIAEKITVIGCCLLVIGFTSCNDFLTIYPTDRIVGADFWKTKADVDQMVDGCYLSMLDYSIQERAIIWGAYRSDELAKRTDYVDNTLDNISAVNLLPTNRYSNWSAFYKVINNCNIVLNHAADVMAEDPEFTMGDYQVVRAQMLALRSLCYFYLVRTFRDVPYVTHSFEDDSQIELPEQSSPDEVLQNCLNDLKEAEPYIMRTGAYVGSTKWCNWGYMTRSAVHALMSDIYLWRASMTHNAGDYQQAIVYADSVINAKHAYYKQNEIKSVTTQEEDIYHLEDGDMAFSTIFGTNQGNSHESILEWQYNGRNNSNRALENYYYQEGDDNSHRQTSILMASLLFSSVSADANNADGKKIYLSKNDYRFWNNVYEANNEEALQMSIRKMVDATSITNLTLNLGPTKSNSREFREFRQNWIVYRLTDIMLMKAEALVATAANDSDQVSLKKAFDLVQVVNKRSMKKNATDTLKFDGFSSKAAMELLVLAERERELCFEGKRWFDLMRYCYRHMEGVDIRQKLADASSWPALYSPMLNLVIRKYSGDGGGDAVSYKMKSEPYLYWPILESETKVNKFLKQNPVYIQEKTTSKN